MKVPADSILIEGQDVLCVESDITGESEGLFKTPLDYENHKQGADCILLARSYVSEGFGRALVVCVGRQTVAGAII